MTDSCVYYFDVGNTRLKLWACKGGDLVAEAGLAHAGDLAKCFSVLPPEFFRLLSFIALPFSRLMEMNTTERIIASRKDAADV